MVSVKIFGTYSTHRFIPLFQTNEHYDSTITPEIIKSQQLALEKVHTLYSSLLAEKKYENISMNYGDYLGLLSKIKTIDTNDPKIKLFLQIVKNALTGSFNSLSFYREFAYNEVTMLSLNTRISEILSNKNESAVLSSASGRIVATKVVVLSPLFSHYIYIYGMPDFGVGFDPVKLSFLQNLV